MMNIQTLILAGQRPVQRVITRSHYYKLKRTKVPPMQERRESPYIVGPYLKPDYLPREYLTEPLTHRKVDDFDHAIYDVEKIEPDESRKVKLLLIDDVEGLGVAGQVVDAYAKHGSSKLIAMKKAEYYTDFTRSWYKFGPRSNVSASSALSPRTARALRSQIFKLPITNKTTVQPWHISLALRLAGCICPIDAIDQSSIQEYSVDDAEGLKCTIVINNHERVETRFSYAEGSPVKDSSEKAE